MYPLLAVRAASSGLLVHRNKQNTANIVRNGRTLIMLRIVCQPMLNVQSLHRHLPSELVELFFHLLSDNLLQNSDHRINPPQNPAGKYVYAEQTTHEQQSKQNERALSHQL